MHWKNRGKGTSCGTSQDESVQPGAADAMNGAAQLEASMRDLKQRMVVALQKEQFEECKGLKAQIAWTKAEMQTAQAVQDRMEDAINKKRLELHEAIAKAMREDDFDLCISLQAELRDVESSAERPPGGPSNSADSREQNVSQEECLEGRRAILETLLKGVDEKLAAAKQEEDFEKCSLLKAERSSLEVEKCSLLKAKVTGAQVTGAGAGKGAGLAKYATQSGTRNSAADDVAQKMLEAFEGDAPCEVALPGICIPWPLSQAILSGCCERYLWPRSKEIPSQMKNLPSGEWLWLVEGLPSRDKQHRFQLEAVVPDALQKQIGQRQQKSLVVGVVKFDGQTNYTSKVLLDADSEAHRVPPDHPYAWAPDDKVRSSWTVVGAARLRTPLPNRCRGGSFTSRKTLTGEFHSQTVLLPATGAVAAAGVREGAQASA